MKKKVFVNRTLNLKKITHIGLDMDHTLIRYKTENFEKLAHEIMLKKLVSTREYPESILNLKFEYNRAIKGLVIDKNAGNLLKVSRFGGIKESFHGLKPIEYYQRKKIFANTFIDISEPNYDTIDTNFSISFATLFAQLVELKNTSEFQSLPEYNQIAADINYALDQAHQDGSLKSVVRDNLADYIIQDEKIVHHLEKFIKHGKKIFIVTNSEYPYSKLLLDYAINPFLKDHKSWMDLFEITITGSKKPRFFYDNLRFLKIDPETGSMTNVSSKLTPGIYQGGSANVFTSDLNLDPGNILYIGDHIYGDVVRLKKDCSWRTGLIFEELDDEIKSNDKCSALNSEVEALMAEKIPIEIKIDELISDEIENNHKNNRTEINQLLEKVSQLDKTISPLITKIQSHFNPYWGEIMRTGIEESYFAYQVERFADIYMPTLLDFFEQSPRAYYRSSRRLMAHDDGQ